MSQMISSLIGLIKGEGTKNVESCSRDQRMVVKRCDILLWFANQCEAGSLACQHVYEQFKTWIDTQNTIDCQKKPEFQLIAEKALEIAKKRLTVPKENEKSIMEYWNSWELGDVFKVPLQAERMPNEEETKIYKEASQKLEEKIVEVIKNFAESFIDKCRNENEVINPAFIKEIKRFKRKQIEMAADLQGQMRFEIIHRKPLWDPDKVICHVMGHVMEHANFRCTSLFRPLGPGKTSQAPRCEEEDRAVPTNFFRTTFSFKLTGVDEEVTIFDASRSGITVEFDLDVEKRPGCNRALVKQVIDANIEAWIEQLSPEQLLKSSFHDPLVFKHTTINLLTPDFWRSFEAKHFNGAQADDERTLALENLKAHRKLQGNIFEYQLRDSTGQPLLNREGKPLKICVKYDLLFFNVPCNVLYEKMPSFLTNVFQLGQAQNEGIEILTKRVEDQIDSFQREATASGNISEEELIALHRLITLREVMKQSRKDLTLKTKLKQITESDLAFIKWQRESFWLAKEIFDGLKKTDRSEEFKKRLRVFQKGIQLFDLLEDTMELLDLMKSKDSVEEVDSIPITLVFVTRLIYLTSLIDGRVHFGCRSGKDRTGLVDIEIKLLAVLIALKGRVPSFREQEQMTDIEVLRRLMTTDSGNMFEFVEAVMGTPIGLNIGGTISTKSCKNEDYKKTMENVKAFAEMAWRPTTKLPVIPAFIDKWKERRHKNSLTLSAHSIEKLAFFLRPE